LLYFLLYNSAYLAQEFRDQLVNGAPTDADEKALRTLLHQIIEKKVIVKLFLQYTSYTPSSTLPSVTN
jgi:hypothetical protein